MDIFYYNTPIYWKHFSNFSNLQKNITSTERIFVLDAVLKPCWGGQHAFQRRSARLVLARPKIVLNVDLGRAIWKSSGTPQHSTASKIGLTETKQILCYVLVITAWNQHNIANTSEFLLFYNSFDNPPG